MDAEIFKKLVRRYQEKGLILREPLRPHNAYQDPERKYQLVKHGKIVRTLNPAELLEDARKRGIIKTEF